jgi:DNA-binding beta-propeller fold protein YncE
MTTIEATPEPGPEQSPPGGGETGGAGVPDLLTEEERRRRKAKRLMIILAVVAAIIAILIYRGCTGNAPIPGIIAPKLPHYSFSIYGASRPLGVAVSPSGDRIYVTESDGKRLVRVYNRSGHQVGTLKPSARSGQWSLPVYVTVDPITNDVYVSDRLRQTVDVFKASGAFRGKFRAGGRLGGGMQPLGVAFGPRGNFYVTDVSGRSHRVLIFGRDGKLLRKLGSPGDFSFPNGIAVDAPGNVFVADSNHGRLAIFSPAGKLIASIRRGVGEGDLGLPRGVAINSDGRLYVVDTSNQTVKVYRFDKSGTKPPTYIGSFGQEGLGNGMFQFPNGVATDSSGRIYVTDRENDRVQVWKY